MSVAVYNKALTYAKNTLLGLSCAFRKNSFLTCEEIIVDVAEDCFLASLEKNMSDRDVVIFCKYRTRQLFFFDRKHKALHANVNEISADFVPSKAGRYKSVSSLKKIDLVKKMTLDGLENEEIMRRTGFPRSTVCYLQKQAGVKCVNSRRKYKKWEADIVKMCVEKMTKREVGIIFGWTERQVERCMRDFGIYSPQKGGRKPKKGALR